MYENVFFDEFLLKHIRLKHLDRQEREEVNEIQQNEYELHGMPVCDIAQEIDNRDNSDGDGHSESDREEQEELSAELVYFENFDQDTLKQLSMSLLIKLRSTASVPYSSVQDVMDSTKIMFEDTISSLKHSMMKVMQAHGIDTEAEDVRDLCTKFSAFQNPFLSIETLKQQSDYMVEKLLLVKPVEISLGMRFDQTVDRKTGQILRKIVQTHFNM